MATKKKKVEDKQEVQGHRTAHQNPAPNPGEAVLEVGQEVEPTTVADVVTPDGVLSSRVKLDETIGSY